MAKKLRFGLHRDINPGVCMIKGQMHAIISARQLKKGRNKGKFEVIMPEMDKRKPLMLDSGKRPFRDGKKVIVEEIAIRRWPTQRR